MTLVIILAPAETAIFHITKAGEQGISCAVAIKEYQVYSFFSHISVASQLFLYPFLNVRVGLIQSKDTPEKR